MIELMLIGNLWEGIARVDGEYFKVKLFPGSATKEWEAILMEHTFVELNPDKPIFKAIKGAHDEHINLRQPLTKDQLTNFVLLMEEHPELAREVEEILKGKGGEEG